MGLTGLWQQLGEGRVPRRLCAESGQLGPLVDDLDGQVVALDLGLLVCQALTQVDLKEYGFSESTRVAKLTLERCSNLLRFGAIPVGVTDGKPPAEKFERLQKRNGFAGRYRWSSDSDFQRHLRLSGDVMKALGLTCMQAPGEGEALCAQLAAVGAATSVWTTDGDALLFGAPRVYRTLKLSRQNMKTCETERVDLRDVRRFFGVGPQDDCHEALVAFALLSGSDYAVDGANGVGATGVVRALRHLIATLPRGEEHQEPGLLAHIKRCLSSCEDGADADAGGHGAALRATCCTGCGHCGHDSGGVSRVAHSSKHKKHGCEQCGTQSGCLSKREGQPCGCPFHAGADARHAAKVLARARDTPEFLSRFDARVAAFSAERDAARQAAAQLCATDTRLTWARRPDVDRLHAVMGGLNGGGDGGPSWSRDTLLRKVLPLLLLWDAAHPGPTGRATGTCFRVTQVLKPSGEGAACGLPVGSAHAVQWAAVADAPAAQAEDIRRGLELLSKDKDKAAAAADGGNASRAVAPDAHYLWTRVLRRHAAELLARCEADWAAKQERTRQAAARRAEREAKRAAEQRTQPKINALLPVTQRSSVTVPASRLHPCDEVMPPPVPSCSDGAAPSGGYRTAFGLPRDDEDDSDGDAEVAGVAAAAAAAAAAPPPDGRHGDDSESEELPAGWADRTSKRASPVKPHQAGGTPPKKAKPRPAAASDTPAPGTTVKGRIDSFFQRKHVTPATVAQPQTRGGAAPGAVASRGGAARQLGFGTGGPVTEGVIDLCSPPAAPEVVDLSASPDAA